MYSIHYYPHLPQYYALRVPRANTIHPAHYSPQTLHQFRNAARVEIQAARAHLTKAAGYIQQAKQAVDKAITWTENYLAATNKLLAETDELLSSKSRIQASSTQSPRNSVPPSLPVTSNTTTPANTNSNFNEQLREVRKQAHKRWSDQQASTSNTAQVQQQRPTIENRQNTPVHSLAPTSIIPLQTTTRVVDLGPPRIEDEIPNTSEHTNSDHTSIQKRISFVPPRHPFECYTAGAFRQLIEHFIRNVEETYWDHTSRYPHQTVHRQSKIIADSLIKNLNNIKNSVRTNGDVKQAAQRLSDVLNSVHLVLPTNNEFVYLRGR